MGVVARLTHAGLEGHVEGRILQGRSQVFVARQAELLLSHPELVGLLACVGAVACHALALFQRRVDEYPNEPRPLGLVTLKAHLDRARV